MTIQIEITGRHQVYKKSAARFRNNSIVALIRRYLPYTIYTIYYIILYNVMRECIEYFTLHKQFTNNDSANMKLFQVLEFTGNIPCHRLFGIFHVIPQYVKPGLIIHLTVCRMFMEYVIFWASSVEFNVLAVNIHLGICGYYI